MNLLGNDVIHPVLRETARLSVLLVGAGPTGWRVARELSPFVHSLTVLDHEKIRDGDLGAGLLPTQQRATGQPNVSALAEDLRSAFPGLLVIPVPERIAGDGNDRLLQVISVADLVVCTADDPHTMARVNAICYERSLPTIMGCLHERGHTGTIAVSVPPGPCLRCAMRLKDFKELAQARGAGVLSLDFDLVSFAISRLAIDILAFRRWGKWPEESAFPDWCNRVTLQTTHPVRWQSERQEKMRGCVVCDQPTQPKGGAKG